MDLKLLRTFIVVAKELNFHRAAERLFLAQPTITVHIRQLEEIVGYSLFERIGKRIKLTPAGERFRIHADRILEAHDEALSDLARWKMGYDDRLDLLLSPLCAEFTLPLIWRKFTTTFPSVEIRIYTTLSPSIGNGIAAGRSHIGLSRVPSSHPDTRSELLFTDPVALIAQGTPEVKQADYWELLANHPLLAKNHPEYWEDILHQLHVTHAPIRPMHVSQVSVTKKLIKTGKGVSFLPLSTVDEEIKAGTLTIVPTPDLRLPAAGTYLITPRNKYIPQAAQDFMGLLQQLTF